MRPTFETVLLAAAVLAAPAARAADKNGAAPQAISLPAGPGSIQGLGESFQPQINSGSGSYTLPLALPRGSGGMTPELALAYDSGGGNGVLGLGWSMAGIPSIRRSTDRGIPLYVDGPNGIDDDLDGHTDNPEEPDRYTGADGEELVPLADGTFRAETESAFLRYRRAGAGWEARSRDGGRMLFGQGAGARIEDGGRTFEWLLERREDRNGNAVEYEFLSDPASPARKHLRRIRWGSADASFAVVLRHEEGRPDVFTSFRSGFEQTTSLRVVEIDVTSQAIPAPAEAVRSDFDGDGKVDALIRRWRLEYDPSSHLSLLVRVTQVGRDGATALPSWTARYGAWTPVENASAVLIRSRDAPPVGFESGSVELIDMNGDALPDLLSTAASQHRVYTNRGIGADGRLAWGPGQPVGNAPSVDIASERTHLADATSDGLSDLLVKVSNTVFLCYPNTGREAACLKGQMLSEEVRGEDGTVFSRSEARWEIRVLADGVDGRSVSFAAKEAMDRTVLEGETTGVRLRTEMEYDDHGNVVAERRLGVADAPGDEVVTERTFDVRLDAWLLDLMHTETVFDGAGTRVAEQRFTHDERGNLILLESWLDTEDRFVPALRQRFDAFGNVIESTDPRGNRRTTSFDPLIHASPVAETIHLGDRDLTMTAEHDLGLGTVTGSVSFAGERTTYDYDALGRLIEKTMPGGAGETYEYRLSSPVSHVIQRRREDAEGGTPDAYAYSDGRGRPLLKKLEAGGGLWRCLDARAYDARGLEASTWLPFSSGSPDYEPPDPALPRERRFHDVEGRVVRTLRADGSESRTEHRPLAELVHDGVDVARGGSPDLHRYDGLGRKVSVEERNGAETYLTRYAWDARGELVSIVDALGNTRRFRFDSLHRLVEVDDPNRGRLSFGYDDSGNRVLRSDAKGQVVAWSHDAADRLTEIIHRGAAPGGGDLRQALHAYDAPAGELDFGDGTSGVARNVAGRLAWVQDPSGEEHFSYDERGNVVALGDATLAWDFEDRMARYSRTGIEARYVHDHAGRRASRIVERGGAREETLYVDRAFEVRGGAVAKYAFLDERRIARIEGRLDPTRELVQRLPLASGWNLVAAAVASAARLRDAFGADADVYEARGASYGPVDPETTVPSAKALWVHAPSARLAVLRGPAARPGAGPSPGPLHAWPRLEPFRPEQLGDPPLLVHDAGTRRWIRRDPMLPPFLSEAPADLGAAQAFWSTRPVDLAGTTPSAAVVFYHQDHLGSTALLTDSSGAVLEERTYYPFGAVRNVHRPGRGSPVDYELTGKERDAESGLVAMGARSYLDVAGVFLGPDPRFAEVARLGFGSEEDRDSLARFLANPQMGNTYAYALRNPLRFVDPSGLEVVISPGLRSTPAFVKAWKVFEGTQEGKRLIASLEAKGQGLPSGEQRGRDGREGRHVDDRAGAAVIDRPIDGARRPPVSHRASTSRSAVAWSRHGANGRGPR